MPSQPSDQPFIDRDLLFQLAGPKAFARGEAYFTENRVRHLQAGTDRAVAKVSGTKAYRVKLWHQRGQLHHACTCPAGREEVFCKHCVAVGLAWLGALEEQTGGQTASEHGAGQSAQARPRGDEAGVSREKLRDYLRSLDKDRLVSLALEATDYDDILHRRVLLELIGVATPGGKRGGANSPAAAEPRTPDFEHYVQLLREAIECADYVDYHAIGDYAQGVEEAIRPLGDLLKAGHAAAVVELAEYALLELDRSSDMVDTGDGALNSIYDDLQHYHLEACRLAKPDPEALAARLLAYELEGGLGVFNNAVNTYAEILGVRGVNAWRRLLTQEWTSLPSAPAPGARPAANQPSIDYRRFQLNALMERLARSEGDTNALIAIKQRDLSSAHDYLALAELHFSQGRVEESAHWAELGAETFPNQAGSAGLSDFLVGVYEKLGRHEGAISLLWKAFARSSSLEDFRALKSYIQAENPAEWPAWRHRAVNHIRESASAAPAQSAEGSRADRSRLVQFLLEEGLDGDALAEAKAGGCSPDLWLVIAERREAVNPAEALRIYQEQLAPIIARGDQRAYREAISLLTRIGHLLDRLGRADDFGTYRAEVRAANRQKRSFLKLLDGIKLPPRGK